MKRLLKNKRGVALMLVLSAISIRSCGVNPRLAKVRGEILLSP